jgi:hypothetical protein
MWSLRYQNRWCNEINREKDHIEHIERVILAKPHIENTEPFRPSMFIRKMMNGNTERGLMDQEKKKNNITLGGRLDKIFNSHSIFHPSKIKIKRCPAFQSTGFKERYFSKSLKKNNNNFYTRIRSSKTLYPIEKFQRDYEKKSYLEHNISQNRDFRNPSLMFKTPSQVMCKIGNFLKTQPDPSDMKNITNEDRPFSNIAQKLLRLNENLSKKRPITSNKNSALSTKSTINTYSPSNVNFMKCSFNSQRKSNNQLLSSGKNKSFKEPLISSDF